MATLTSGTMTNLNVQDFQNYILEIPTVTNFDSYVGGGAIGYGNYGWGFDFAFYSTGTAVYLIQPA